MENWGFNTGFLVIQLFNLALLCGWPIFSLVTLFALKNKKLTGTKQAIWVLIVVAVPFLGSLAYWIVQPAEESE